jgi:hypothetical protein
LLTFLFHPAYGDGASVFRSEGGFNQKYWRVHVPAQMFSAVSMLDITLCGLCGAVVRSQKYSVQAWYCHACSSRREGAESPLVRAKWWLLASIASNIVSMAALDWEAESKSADSLDAQVAAILPVVPIPRHCQSAATRVVKWPVTRKSGAASGYRSRSMRVILSAGKRRTMAHLSLIFAM